MSDLQFKIKLLELEVKALRSVLSEWDEDKTIYTQYIKAECIRELIYSLKPVGEEK